MSEAPLEISSGNLGRYLLDALQYKIEEPDNWMFVDENGNIVSQNGLVHWDFVNESQEEAWEECFRELYEEEKEGIGEQKNEVANLFKDFEFCFRSSLVMESAKQDPANGVLKLAELAQLVDQHLNDFIDFYDEAKVFGSNLNLRKERHERLLVLAQWLVLLAGPEALVESPFHVTKQMLDTLYGTVLTTQSLMKSRKVEWPTHIEPWRKGTDKKWDYVSVRTAIENSSYSNRGLLLDYLPKSPTEAKKKYLELSTTKV